MRLVVMSDTHSMHHKIKVPEGDILIHCGDFCGKGNLMEIDRFNAWLGMLPHRHKIVIAGNHDTDFEEVPKYARALITHAIYLEDSGIEIEGLCFYGSPWQPEYMNWSFNLPRGEALKAKWDQIPSNTDVLVTHSPPHGILDQTVDGILAGCEELREAVEYRIQPRYHFFGHIHEGYGKLQLKKTLCVNASICTARYAPTNPVVVLEV